MHKAYTLGKDEQRKLEKRLAKELKTLRNLCGWSQETLASVIGVTRQTILAVENGKRDMTWTMFLAFSFVFLGNEKTRKAFMHSGAYTSGLADFLNIGVCEP